MRLTRAMLSSVCSLNGFSCRHTQEAGGRGPAKKAPPGWKQELELAEASPPGSGSRSDNRSAWPTLGAALHCMSGAESYWSAGT